MRSLPVQLVVAIDTNKQIDAAKLVIAMPQGLSISDQGKPKAGSAASVSVDLGSIASSVSRSFSVTPDPHQLQKAEYRIQLSLDYAEGGVARSVVQFYPITAAPTISVAIYLFFGLSGIFLGYWIRIFVKILSSTTPPQPAPVATGNPPQNPGNITAWVMRHYYAVDMSVTEIIGFMVLIAMIKDGNPPDNGSYWYSSLATGLGLGTLTNSDLFTRLR